MRRAPLPSSPFKASVLACTLAGSLSSASLDAAPVALPPPTPDTSAHPAWADATASPRPPSGAAEPRDRALYATCGAPDRALISVAARLAVRALSTQDMEALAQALRTAGNPHVWPRAWTLAGKQIDKGEALSRMKHWLSTLHGDGQRRCGLAWGHDADGLEVLAVVAVDAAADLDPIPARARPGTWIGVNATVLVPATGAKVVVLGPTGAPHSIPTSLFDGRIQAKFNADHVGAWLVQVLIDGANGPRPVLEAPVFVGVQPPDSSGSPPEAPGEDAAAGGQDAASAIALMVTAARKSEGLGPLGRESKLDRIARAHAEAMKKGALVAHDAGDGDPESRAKAAGLAPAVVGENVAHAGSAALAHRALWASPSHRENLLQNRFDHVGIGVIADDDGSVWVTELFTGAR